MKLSESELRLICAKASNLSERLSGQYVPLGDDPALASRRLVRWRNLFGSNAAHELGAQLTALGNAKINEAKLLSLLGPVTQAKDVPLPQWTLLLDEIVASLAQSFNSETECRLTKERFRHGKASIPFEHLYWPIAEFAWDRVIRNSIRSELPIKQDARKSLQEHLIRRLSGVASALLQTGFLARVSVENSAIRHHFFGGASLEAGSQNSSRHYMDFVTEQGKDGLCSLFTRFPVAGRLISQVTARWIEFVGEFLDRLQQDSDGLADHFNAGTALGSLLKIKAGMSDPHQGGRSVLILRFAGDVRVVYKPRSMEVDKIFYELVRTINRDSPDLDLGILETYSRPNYGWVEFARHAPCRDRSASERYYRRAGATACLIEWLRGIDFHRENVVAAGEYPVLVDLECLAHPLRTDEIQHSTTGDPTALANSVLRSGLLPLRQPRVSGDSLYENSGFSGSVRQRSFLPAPVWENANTDRMRLIYRRLHQYHSDHRAKLNGRFLGIGSFEREVVSGYETTARYLEGASGRRCQKFETAIDKSLRRRVKRPTFIYAMLIRHSLDIKFLQDGVDRSIEMMTLPLVPGEEADWRKEIDSLEAMDIPFFQHIASKDDGALERQSIRSHLERSQQIKNVRLSVRRAAMLHDGMICPVGSHRGEPPGREDRPL